MAFKTKEIIVHIRKGLVFFMKIIYRSGCDHPFVWGMMFFLLILYMYLPSLFGFLVSSSPVIVCTALLLGTILLYADPNIPETEEGQNVGTGDDNVFSEDEDFLAETHVARKAAHLRESKGLKAKATSSSHFGSSLGSPWQPNDGHDASAGTDSDHTESSSPDASVSDIIPMLDEFHPLLDFDAPQTALRSGDDSDAASSLTSQDQESHDGSIEEETENLDDEEDEAQEEKDDANEVVLKWTADDQKNLMDLGTSELERNQRLENLIAKRRARKFLSFHGEKNLIDLDSNDPVPSMEDRSRFNIQISSISAPRQNPFDIPVEEEIMGLPPIPGSAPSVLQPRRNPFDVPYDQGEENSNVTRVTMHQQGFLPSPQGDMFFQKHENFTTSASSSGDIKQERVNSVDAPRKQIKVDKGINMVLNASIAIEETHQKANTVGAVEMETRQGEYSSPDSDARKLEVIVDRYDVSSSSSSEAYENHSKMSHGPGNPQQGRDNSSTHPDDSVQSVSADSDLSRVANPVYDSSPSAVEKSLSNSSAIEDVLLVEGKQGFTSGNPLISGFHTDSAEQGSAPRPHDSKVSSKERLLESDSEGIWVAPSILALVDENESRSKEINEITERDVIQVGLSVIDEEFSQPMSPVLPKFVLPSRLFVGSSDDAVEVDAMINNGASSNSLLTGKPLTPRDVPLPTILQSDRAGLDKLLSNVDLPSIPEEHSEYFRVEDQHESTIDQTAASSGLTDTHLVEESEGFAEDSSMAIDKDVGDDRSSLKQSDKSSNVSVKKKSSGAKSLGKIRNMAKAKFWP